jgi:hypothetical protein
MTNFTNDIKTATSILLAGLNVMNRTPSDYLMYELKEAVSNIIENLGFDEINVTIDGDDFFAVHDSHQEEFLTARAKTLLEATTDMEEIPAWIQRNIDWDGAAEEMYSDNTFEGIVGCETSKEIGDYTVYA